MHFHEPAKASQRCYELHVVPTDDDEEDEEEEKKKTIRMCLLCSCTLFPSSVLFFSSFHFLPSFFCSIHLFSFRLFVLFCSFLSLLLLSFPQVSPPLTRPMRPALDLFFGMISMLVVPFLSLFSIAYSFLTSGKISYWHVPAVWWITTNLMMYLF